MEEEFLDFDSRSAWNSVYQEIRNKSNNYSYTYKDAKRIENKNLNRYRDVNPFDHSRVKLQRGDRDYINASLVEVPSAKRSYILTQGPLPATTGHFWLMIWEQKSKAILMLNRVIEKNAVKCHQYWPIGSVNGGEEEIMLKDVGLMVSFVRQEEACNYTVREFTLTDFQSGNSREVLQFHYTTWPDFGVPESPAAFLNFLFAVRDSGALNENVGPAVVHCSAGIGRSGTFCLVDSCLVLIEQKGDSSFLNIREHLLQMRKYRMGLIQTPDQLRFSYMAIIEGSKEVLSKKNSHELMPSTIKTKQSELSNVNEKTSQEESESTSESSDEGLADCKSCDSLLSTPPPLPPRPIRNHNISPSSCNSVSEPLLTSETYQSDFTLSSSVSDQNKNSEVLNTSEMLIANHRQEEDDRLNQKLSGSNKMEINQSLDVSVAELKKRKRKERSDKTAAIVQKIKKKQKESEIWHTRRSLMKRLSFGLVILLGTGVFVYRYYSKG